MNRRIGVLPVATIRSRPAALLLGALGGVVIAICAHPNAIAQPPTTTTPGVPPTTTAVPPQRALGGPERAPSPLRPEALELDLSAWRRLPVFHRGRQMPLDSFARRVVREITGREKPKIDPRPVLRDRKNGAGEDDETEAAAAAVAPIFPDGRPRKFSADELLLAWLVEPDRWMFVPLLEARGDRLREQVLDVPVRDPGGHRLKHINPQKVIQSPGFGRYLMAMTERGNRERPDAMAPDANVPRSEELDERVEELYNALALFRLLTYDPTTPQTLQSNRPLTAKLMAAARLLGEVTTAERRRAGDDARDQSPPIEVVEPSEQVRTSRRDVQRALAELAATIRPSFTAATAGPLLARLEQATARLTQAADRQRERVFSDPDSTRQQRAAMNRMAARAAELHRVAGELHMTLYNIGHSLRVAPALDPLALRADRKPDDEHQPWLSLQAVLYGSDELLAGYPQEPLRRARAAFADLAEAYRDRADADRPQRVRDASERFAAAMRALGEQVEPLRRQLPIEDDQTDRERILAATAYPPPGYHQAELHYNRVHPFLWAWVIYLLATAGFALSFGLVRRVMFWLAVALTLAAMGMVAYGLGLRTVITGWASVTNMFETVVFVAMVVGMMGLWFTLAPLLQPGILRAWSMTALPRRRPGSTGETPVAQKPDTDEPAVAPKPEAPTTARWVLLAPRLLLTIGLFWVLTMLPYGSAGRVVISLVPRAEVGSQLPSLNNLLTWSVGLGVLAITLWLTPRVLLATLMAPATIVAHWMRHGVADSLDEAQRRRLYAGTGAAVGFLAALTAYQAPIFNRDIQALQPILRDNFWLVMHVVSITASYGAGALAWGLANIALAYYLFGRYRQSPDGSGRIPPAVCGRLALFNYRSIQVAVLLLAIGTILGALWADVAWGRFWSFDAKETWALISILVYMIILHARYIGWSGDFGMAVGAVLGASAILMAWYGVNYVLGSGLHTYGGGTGGSDRVLLLVGANWLFVGAAAVRYLIETTGPTAGSELNEQSDGTAD